MDSRSGRPMTEPSTFRRLWQLPGRYEDRATDRRVTFLELFFDLVFVVVISQLARHLARERATVGKPVEAHGQIARRRAHADEG